MDVAEEKGVLTNDEVEQVQAQLHVYRLTLKNFDGLFSLLRDKQSELDVDNKIAQLAKYLDAAMMCLRRLNMSITPKLHILEDHLLDVIKHVETLQYFDKEFVERAHQKGLKYNRITKGMTCNPFRKYSYMARWESERSQIIFDKSQKRKTLQTKRGGKKRKLEHGKARQTSVEITPEELQNYDPDFFQSAEEMNVVINKRLALLEQQQDTA